ncbi:MAG: EscU/YscU/HrcU family type III secretion system export apparatus switch protein [Flavobacteriaceae bacterium]
MSGDETPAKTRAVALRYDHPGVPVVTAKGEGAFARRIIEEAEKHGVLVEENPALAEALSQIAVDDEIPEELYKAVAEVISYVMRMSRRL